MYIGKTYMFQCKHPIT